MKLSKKNQARQRAIAKALASGKALDGLLVGVAAATLVGCDRSPFRVMGAIDVQRPDNLQAEQIDKGCAVEQPNAANENPQEFATRGDPPRRVQKKCAIEQPNAANENPEEFVTMGESPPEDYIEMPSAVNENSEIKRPPIVITAGIIVKPPKADSGESIDGKEKEPLPNSADEDVDVTVEF